MKNKEAKGYKMSDPEIAAQFYGISIEDYLKGQERNSIKENDTNDDFYIHEYWLSKYLKG